MFLGLPVSRRDMGLPDDWDQVEGWCRGEPRDPAIQSASLKKKDVKNWGIANFGVAASPRFWKDFPRRPLPVRPETKISTINLARKIANVRNQWTVHKTRTAEAALDSLVSGANAYQKCELPGDILKNAPSIEKHGNSFTTTLQEWIEKGFVAGPFFTPPVLNFRANVLMAEEQKDKVRPILNLSSPKGTSFNCNVDKLRIPKTYQSSARLFGQSLMKVGPGAIMSKMDMRDAFKLVPARIRDLRLQGFQWMGAYFIDTQQIFGGSPSVANFDQVAETVLNIVLSETRIDSKQVHRTLDDVACVAQPGTGECQEFTAAYRRICSELGVPLADNCPLKEKAFANETQGTVLGVEFNTERLEWRLSSRKISAVIEEINLMRQSGHSDLKQIQKLAGRLNHFAQMAPFMHIYKRTMNQFLAAFAEDEEILLPVPDQFVADLAIWEAVVADSASWLPIPVEVSNPPYGSIEFVSDAAGGSGTEEWVGVASIGLRTDKSFWFLCRGSWPQSVFTYRDEKGAALSQKMTTLELIGLLLPILTVPDVVRNRDIVLGVDNLGVVFAWENGYAKGDLLASVLVRAMGIVAAYLECRVHVRHVPRMTSLASVMADSLTRASTANAQVWAAMVGTATYEPPSCLWSWLSKPFPDWDLGLTLVDYLKELSEF
jgi:hypothetical protein